MDLFSAPTQPMVKTFDKYEFTDVNLFTMDNSVNNRLLKNPLFYERNGNKNYFKIDKPTQFTAALMSISEHNELSALLRKEQIRYSSEYYPAGYFKKQYSPLYSITLDISDYGYNLNVSVAEFGSSYGTIKVNGSYFYISHSGCSGHDEEKGHFWTDFTTGWNVVEKPSELIRLIVSSKKTH